jgi:hypothetical protein
LKSYGLEQATQRVPLICPGIEMQKGLQDALAQGIHQVELKGTPLQSTQRPKDED